jgi:hypothetical protein
MGYKARLSPIIALGMVILVLAACTGTASKPEAGSAFAIYLVRGEVPDPQVDLSLLDLEPTPFLTADDILAYTWETHAIELTDAARERVASLEVPLTTGVPFVVCVGAERIYPGAFWVSYSSMSYNGIVIDTLFAQMDDPIIRLQLGYPESPELFEGEDLRSDLRIRQSLEDAGKLR